MPTLCPICSINLMDGKCSACGREWVERIVDGEPCLMSKRRKIRLAHPKECLPRNDLFPREGDDINEVIKPVED